MIYTSNIRKAMNLAYNAHNGQVDKSNVPYIYHPIHLAEQMETEEECLVALLHDTVEDTDITFEDLEKEFSSTVVEAVKLLTNDKTTSYMEYVRKIKENPIAKKVKLADLRHNSDMTRKEDITDKDRERNQRYKKAIEFLSE